MRIEIVATSRASGWVLAIAMCAIVSGLHMNPRDAAAAPPTAQLLPIQGMARDAEYAVIPAGDVAVRIYIDSLGGAPVYDSGNEFSGAIVQGLFDVVVGRTTPLMLDQEQSYFLELDAAGVEILGDAAGGRWRFYPGGGSHARTDLEDRLAALEAAVGPPGAMNARSSRRDLTASRDARVSPAGAITDPLPRVTNFFSSTHAILGLGMVSGSGGHSSTASLFAQPVGPRGSGTVRVELGPYYLFAPPPNPMIRFIRDVPADQGRYVRIRWRNDLRERPYNASDVMPRISSYTLYRRVNPGQALALRERPHRTGSGESAGVHAMLAGSRRGPSSAASVDPDEPSTLAFPPGEWDVLTSIPATLDTTYQTVVPTLCDSTTSGVCWSVFLVRAITDQPGTYYTSAMDSGYAVDNFAPGVPEGLTIQSVQEGTSLSWQPSAAPDFQYFRVYRDTDPSFTPSPTTLVHATSSTGWIDPVPGSFTYKVTAVDFSGNESEPATTALTIDVAEAETPAVLRFVSLAPNPFQRSSTMVIDVPERSGIVNLTVFDVSGRRVTTLASGALPAGRHTFTWDGRADGGQRVSAGIYITRLMGLGRTMTRRVTLLP